MAKQNKFGTFGGVYIPSILTILGVIMYLRLPAIVGEAGLYYTLGIIAIAHIISLTTGLSISSIATDKKVEAGGTYYMISRSMGLPIGGTIGIALFLGLSFSVSLYLIGLAETIIPVLSNAFDLELEVTTNNIRLVGMLALILITVITLISTALAIKMQYVILGLILLSLFSIILGTGNTVSDFSAPLLSRNTGNQMSLMVLFGIFFPAVTGFEAGVSMSGDLKDPKRSIPRGSLAAIITGLVVYVALAFFLAYTVDPAVLRNTDIIPMQFIAKYQWMVVAGIAGATISSALGSILGAPRILQATSVDKITPLVFSKGSGKDKEPRNALILTFVIAGAGIMIGELNAIANIVSMVFITTYGFLNISAAFEKWTSSDFRPDFKVSGWISLFGFIACLVVMIQLNPGAMFLAMIFLGLLFFYLKNQQLRLESGDAWSGVWASLVKTGLTKLTRNKPHIRNWRPNVIMFTGNPHTRDQMITTGKAIAGKLGILSAFELVEGGDKMLLKTSSNLYEEEDTTGYFHYRFVCKDVYAAMDSISRVYGFSGVEPNTVFMGWSRTPRSKEQYINMLTGFKRNEYSTIFLDYKPDKSFGEHRTIDIWWSGKDKNLSFAVKILQHLITSESWNVARTRLLIVNPINTEAETVYRSASALLKSFRVQAEVKVINNEVDNLPLKQLIEEQSQQTDLTIVGIPDQQFLNLAGHYDELSQILDVTGSALIINASRVFEEYEVINPNAGTQLPETMEQEKLITTPAIRVSEFPEIAADIRKLEDNGERVLELFYRKTFAHLIKDHTEIIEELQSRVEIAGKELDKIKDLPELLRRKKAIDKLKSDVFFKINKLVETSLSQETLKLHEEKLVEGLEWYINRLKIDQQKFPTKLKITYPEEDFQVYKTDRTGLKVKKFMKKTLSRISGNKPSQQIAYRRAARLFQYQRRLAFLQGFLQQFLLEEVRFFDELRNQTNHFIIALENTEKKIYSNEESWHQADLLEQVKVSIERFKKHKLNLDMIRRNRFRLEFTRNLQEMSDLLGKVDTDHLVKQKLRKDSYLKAVEQNILQFPHEYETRARTTLNLILIELALHTVENRMEIQQEDFLMELEQGINRRFIRETEQYKATLEENKMPETDRIISALDYLNSLKESFLDMLNRMIPLVENVPENLEIYSKLEQGPEEEAVEIPVAKMLEYYFKSRYQVPLEEDFDQFIEALKRSVYSVKDTISLAEVSLANQDGTGREIDDSSIIAEAITKTEREKTRISKLLEDFLRDTDRKFTEVFEPLSSVKIEESAEEFSSGLRAYQGQQVMTGISKLGDSLGERIRGFIARIFYSRSEGILVARKFNAETSISTNAGNLLDLKEELNPRNNVLTSLPQYYVTLFNGKSHVSRDFWITRPVEESEFKKTLRRYREGYHGAVMILGNRNTGKSAFCRQMTGEHFKSNQVYNMFPPVYGGVSQEDFRNSLAKATQKYGTVYSILSRLSAGSVIIIHDLELFWQKAPGGYEVIELLKDLINRFSSNILFIINTNPYAYLIMDQLCHLNQYSIGTISMQPFDAEELKNLIIRRHRSSGMKVGFETDDELSEIQYARLFDRYFKYSSGTPGTALAGWLANIRKMSNNRLIIEKPQLPTLDPLENIPDDWKMLLIQFILHKRMNHNTIRSVTGWSYARTSELVTAMKRTGLLEEKVTGAYTADPFMQPFIEETFKQEELL